MAIPTCRFSNSLLALVLMLGLLSACSGPTQEQPTGTLSVGVRTTPDPAQLGDNGFAFWVKQNGKQLDHAQVAFRMFMAGMPMNSDDTWITTTPDGGGRYQGSGDFSMGGSWQVMVRVTPTDGTATAVTFPFEIEWKLN